MACEKGMEVERKKERIRSWSMTMPLRECASRFARVLFPEPGAPDIWMSSLRGGSIDGPGSGVWSRMTGILGLRG